MQQAGSSYIYRLLALMFVGTVLVFLLRKKRIKQNALSECFVNCVVGRIDSLRIFDV